MGRRSHKKDEARKRKATRRQSRRISLTERMRCKDMKEAVEDAVEDDDLFALAVQPVSLGSGVEVFGRGRYVYAKGALDGSLRVIRFNNLEAARKARELGIAADEPERLAS